MLSRILQQPSVDSQKFCILLSRYANDSRHNSALSAKLNEMCDSARVNQSTDCLDHWPQQLEVTTKASGDQKFTDMEESDTPYRNLRGEQLRKSLSNDSNASMYATTSGSASDCNDSERLEPNRRWVEKQAQFAQLRPLLSPHSNASENKYYQDEIAASSPPAPWSQPTSANLVCLSGAHDCGQQCQPSSGAAYTNPAVEKPWWWTQKYYLNWLSDRQYQRELEEVFRPPCSTKELEAKLKQFDEFWHSDNNNEEPAMYQWARSHRNWSSNPAKDEVHEEEVACIEKYYRAYKNDILQDFWHAKDVYERYILSDGVMSDKVAYVVTHYVFYNKGKFEEGTYDDTDLPRQYWCRDDWQEEQNFCEALGRLHWDMRQWFEGAVPERLLDDLQTWLDNYHDHDRRDTHI